MSELELTRSHDDRRVYSVAGIGSVRLQGLFSRTGSAESDGTRWSFSPRGFWRREVQATDASGAVVGEFLPRQIRRGGNLRWEGRELTLHPASALRERYALSDGERDLVLLDGKGWGRRPVKITLAQSEPVEPGLLLFAAFIVHRLAASASESAGGSAAASSGVA